MFGSSDYISEGERVESLREELSIHKEALNAAIEIINVISNAVSNKDSTTTVETLLEHAKNKIKKISKVKEKK